MNIDYRTGYRYASEILHDQSTNQMEALVTGLQKWKEPTARNLIAAAQARLDAGVNPEYQRGVIERAMMEVDG
jgi:hypothetical protein